MKFLRIALLGLVALSGNLFGMGAPALSRQAVTRALTGYRPGIAGHRPMTFAPQTMPRYFATMPPQTSIQAPATPQSSWWSRTFRNPFSTRVWHAAPDEPTPEIEQPFTAPSKESFSDALTEHMQRMKYVPPFGEDQPPYAPTTGKIGGELGVGAAAVAAGLLGAGALGYGAYGQYEDQKKSNLKIKAFNAMKEELEEIDPVFGTFESTIKNNPYGFEVANRELLGNTIDYGFYLNYLKKPKEFKYNPPSKHSMNSYPALGIKFNLDTPSIEQKSAFIVQNLNPKIIYETSYVAFNKLRNDLDMGAITAGQFRKAVAQLLFEANVAKVAYKLARSWQIHNARWYQFWK